MEPYLLEHPDVPQALLSEALHATMQGRYSPVLEMISPEIRAIIEKETGRKVPSKPQDSKKKKKKKKKKKNNNDSERDELKHRDPSYGLSRQFLPWFNVLKVHCPPPVMSEFSRLNADAKIKMLTALKV